jgi:hypothetical protein
LLVNATSKSHLDLCHQSERWPGDFIEGPLCLLPADHVQLLHPIGRRGVATVATRDRRWVERAVAIADLPAYATALRGATDTYVSQQAFYGWRRITQLAQLGALYSDLDYRNSRWAGEAPERVSDALLHELDEVRIPAPNYILATGRGLLATWLHDPVPRAALPRWNAAQDRLCKVLSSFGADPRALDAARVFRVSGTRHSGADAIVRPIWMATSAGSMWRWNFEDLLREVLPLERAELNVLRARRAERAPVMSGLAPAHRLTAATYWETVLADLQKLRALRWFGDLPPGHRDTWLFLACNAMAWLAPPFALQREVRALASEAAGWDGREADSRMASILKRAEKAAQGARQEWQGQSVDPRYRFRAAIMVEWLDISPREMREADLRALIDDDLKRQHGAERQQACRRNAGVQPRSEWIAAHTIERDCPWEGEGISRATWYRGRERLLGSGPEQDETGASRCMVA